MKNTKPETIKYARTSSQIAKVLREGYQLKRNVKIKYYSLSSDEVRFRIVSIYQFNPDWIVAYCHLRKEERTFVTSRIRAAGLLKKRYKIPKGWRPQSIVSKGR
jgi:predicted DNA-binding transcriptional regulator YafY